MYFYQELKLFFVAITTLLICSTSSSQTPRPSKIVFIGDSITAGYGLTQSASYPNLIEKKINLSKANSCVVVNAGISGSTTASALSRLKWQIKAQPDLVVLALGANDGLRGTPLTEVRTNLDKTIEFARSKGVKILLAGMKVPPNYGIAYSNDFEKIYATLAKKHNIAFMPFLLSDVAGEKTLNQADSIHPNAKGQEIIAKNIFPYIKKILP